MTKCRAASAVSIGLLVALASACAAAPKPLAPRSADPEREPRVGTAAARGKWVFSVAGCTLCHGQGGKGGVSNRNSETGGKINGLTLVKESYSAKELAQKIREGVREVGRADPHGPVPPLRMPAYGTWLSDQSVTDLVAYLFSIYPKSSAKKDGWDDDDDDADQDEDSKKDTSAKQPSGPKKGDSDDDEKDDEDAQKPAQGSKPAP